MKACKDNDCATNGMICCMSCESLSACETPCDKGNYETLLCTYAIE